MQLVWKTVTAKWYQLSANSLLGRFLVLMSWAWGFSSSLLVAIAVELCWPGIGVKCMLHCPVPCSTILSDCTVNSESTRGCMNVCIFEYSSVCDVWCSCCARPPTSPTPVDSSLDWHGVHQQWTGAVTQPWFSVNSTQLSSLSNSITVAHWLRGECVFPEAGFFNICGWVS